MTQEILELILVVVSLLISSKRILHTHTSQSLMFTFVQLGGKKTTCFNLTLFASEDSGDDELIAECTGRS